MRLFVLLTFSFALLGQDTPTEREAAKEVLAKMSALE